MPHVFIKKSNVRANKRSSLKRPAHVSRITYRLVAKQDVDIRHDLHQGLFKELADERRWEVHAEDLVAIRGMLRHLHDRLGGHGQEKPLGTRTGFIYIMCVWGAGSTSAGADKPIRSVPFDRQRCHISDSAAPAQIHLSAGFFVLKPFKRLICGPRILTRTF